MTVKIIVADDHAIVRRGLRMLLEAQSTWEVCCEADNGRTAVELVHSAQAHVAVLDYSLPLLNALEATRQIRLASPRTEVLVYTMHNNEDVIRDVLKAGARGYVLKTEDDSEIVRAVQALLRKKPYFSPQVAETLLDDFLGGSKVTASDTLTAREREVIQLVAEGQSNRAIEIEQRIIRAYVRLACTAQERDGIRSVSVTRFRGLEVRLTEIAREQGPPGMPPFWLEVCSQMSGCVIDSCGCTEFDECELAGAVDMIERVMRRPLPLH